MAKGREGGMAETSGLKRLFPYELDLPGRIVDYDLENAAVYARLISVYDTEENWRDVARQFLGRDPDTDEVGARRCWNAHLARAKWVAENAYPRAVRDALLANDE
jgi:hypothetical protein